MARAFPALIARLTFLTPPYNYAATLALEVLAGWLDYVTGPTVSVSLFYLLPLTFAAWGPSLALAELYAGVAAAIAAYVDVVLFTHQPGEVPTAVWNVLMEWGTFSLFVLVLFRIRQSLQRGDTLRADLDAARREIQALEELLPICFWCKAVRKENGQWIPVEEYLSVQTSARVSATECPDCARRRSQEQAPPAGAGRLPA